MTHSFLPTELWLDIIQEAVSIPAFLDPDHLPEVTDPLFEKSEAKSRLISLYWETERQRNVFRRVCKLWNNFLRTFDHRYVHMKDIYHGTIPPEAVSKAVRVQFAFCSDDCRLCFPEGMEHRMRNLIPALHSTSPLPAQIVIRDDLHLYRTEIFKLLPHLTNVRVLYNIGVIDPDETTWQCLFAQLPQLQMIRIISRYRPPVEYIPFGASFLTTLSVSYTWTPAAVPLGNSHLPYLQHLRVQPETRHIAIGIDVIMPMIERLGSNLVSLQLGPYHNTTILPSAIWSLCPKLERLDTGMFIDHLPSFNHPLHTISVFAPRLDSTGDDPPILFPFSISIIRGPPLRRLIFNTRWGLFENMDRDHDWIHECASVCADNGVIMEDIDGVSFETISCPIRLPA